MNKTIKNNYLKKIILLIITGLIVITVIIGIILFNSQKKDNFYNQNNLLENNNDNNQIKDNKSNNNIVKKETKSKKLSLIIIIIVIILLLLIIILIALFLFYNINRTFFYFDIKKNRLPSGKFSFESTFRFKKSNLRNLYKYLRFKTNRSNFNQIYDYKIKRCESKLFSNEKRNAKLFINLLHNLKQDNYLHKLIANYSENIFDIIFDNKKYREVMDLHNELFFKNEFFQGNEKNNIKLISENEIIIKNGDNYFSEKHYFENKHQINLQDIKISFFRCENAKTLVLNSTEKDKDDNNMEFVNIYKYAKNVLSRINEEQKKNISLILDDSFKGIFTDEFISHPFLSFSVANFFFWHLKDFFEKRLRSNDKRFKNKKNEIKDFLKKMEDFYDDLIKALDEKTNQNNFEKLKNN